MRIINIAEWILGLFTSAERASAIVGDLTEESDGAMWFWSSVAQTAASLLWRDIAERPGLAVRWGLLGVGISVALLMAWIVFLELAGFGVAAFGGKSFDPSLRGWQILLNVPETWIFPVITGWILARCTRGREMMACTSFLLMFSIVGIMCRVFVPGARFDALGAIGSFGLVLIGALWSRHRRLRRLSTANL